MTKQNSKRGFALSVAVFALVVVGVLVTGGFYLARQETRIGVASERGTAAFYLAERGATEVMSEWDVSTYSALSNWSSASVADTTDDGIWSVDVTKMSSRLYFLLATGTVTDGAGTMGNASRMLGMTVRLNTANIQPRAALATVGEIRIQGSMEISGHDNVPPEWGGDFCDDPAASKPGILIDDTLNITDIGNALIVEGDPIYQQDPTITPDSLLTFGDLTFADLSALADIVFPHNLKITQLQTDSTDLGGGNWLCNDVDYNWGTPLKPDGVCGSRFPIIYAQGDLEISANETGQGILLVEGNLKISGTHIFYGPVIIRGTLLATGGGSGGHFLGGVVAANVEVVETTIIRGNAIVSYSSCAVSRAILNNSSLTRARPLEDRSWVDLSSVISG